MCTAIAHPRYPLRTWRSHLEMRLDRTSLLGYARQRIKRARKTAASVLVGFQKKKKLREKKSGKKNIPPSIVIAIVDARSLALNGPLSTGDRRTAGRQKFSIYLQDLSLSLSLNLSAEKSHASNRRPRRVC